jgi:hypothetical protein
MQRRQLPRLLGRPIIHADITASETLSTQREFGRNDVKIDKTNGFTERFSTIEAT